MTEQTGLRHHDPDKAFQGYTLFAETAREPAPEGHPGHPIHLVDMNGEAVHVWRTQRSLQSYCRLLPNGNLIAPTHDRSETEKGLCGLTELTPDSEIAWGLRCRTDHDFQVLDGGNILVHTIADWFTPRLGPELKRHPYLVEVTREKELVWEWRGDEHVDELEALLSPEAFAHVMDRAIGDFAFDWAHNNTLQIIPPNATYDREVAEGVPEPRFQPGNIVFSYRSNDVIGVIERPSGRIVWAWGPGVIDGQHKPHMLANGNVLIFDNGTLRGYSRVIELNPLDDRIEWEYTAEPKGYFFSPYISGAQRLPNGNTLICDGRRKRLFEVTRDKEVVWDFINPSAADPDRSESVYRCLRYSPEYCRPLLERIGR